MSEFFPLDEWACRNRIIKQLSSLKTAGCHRKRSGNEPRPVNENDCHKQTTASEDRGETGEDAESNENTAR